MAFATRVRRSLNHVSFTWRGSWRCGRFFGFYLNFVKTSQELAKLIPSDATVPGNSLQLLRYDYSNQRPFVNQIMLSRAAETFDLYLTTILRDVFLARPEMLKSEGTVDIATVIEAGNYEDLIWGLIERKVHELSYRPLTDLRKFIVSRTGIDLFPSNEAFEATIIAYYRIRGTKSQSLTTIVE